MGYIKHHSLIVTSHFKKDINEAHVKAQLLFSNLGEMYTNTEKIVTPIFEGIANSQFTFFISPDGSKEGWALSDNCNEKRCEFVKWLKDKCICDFVEVCFGGDDNYNEIINSNE